MLDIICMDSATSTNTLLAEMTDAPHGTVLVAREQTAGRGQRGNSWEAEPGKNLTFSLLLRPNAIPAARQFEISEIVSLAVAEVLARRLQSEQVRIKWPNDIYFGDSKICGMLIENTLCDRNIERSIPGIGINVNQEVFRSDAPNPISMLNIAGREFDLEPLLKEFTEEIVSRFDSYEAAPDPEELTKRYISRLWRAEGFWPYRDNILGEDITARIAAVDPSGLLTLQLPSGEQRTFAFKEVAAVI